MIKKLLLLILVALLGFGLYSLVVNGVSLGDSIQVLSYKELVGQNSRLDTEIASLNDERSKFDVTKRNLESINSDYSRYQVAYNQLAGNASKEAVAEANQREEYMLDYLWIKIGNYANDNNVKFKLTENQTDSTLTFDVTGQYVSIINFIYDIENDKELSFKVNNIIAEGGTTANTKARFVVSGVNIITSEV